MVQPLQGRIIHLLFFINIGILRISEMQVWKMVHFRVTCAFEASCNYDL